MTTKQQSSKILTLKDVKIHFERKHGIFAPHEIVHAVDGVSFDVYQGETLGIVGESGSGKSTLAKALVGLNQLTSGSIVFAGTHHLETASISTWHKLHRKIQLIFQDPVAALNPRMTIAEIIAEPLKIYFPRLSNKEINEQVVHMMQLVGLNVAQMNQSPAEFSGGQCQRIGIARALILGPKLLICDEAVSALDVSIKAQIINLLKELQQKLHLTIIFISHDLSAIKYVSDRVLVMYLGNVMEVINCNELYTNCHHPYTQALLEAVLRTDVAAIADGWKPAILSGDTPSMIDVPKGCVFGSRCLNAEDRCFQVRPELTKLCESASAACHYPLHKIKSDIFERTL